MTRKEANRHLRRFYRALKNDDLRVRISRKIGHFATVDIDEAGAEIALNPDRRCQGGIVTSLIHELVHITEGLMEDKEENKVLALENQIYSALTDRQLTNLMARAFQ